MCGLSRFVDLRDANGNGELLRGINRKLASRPGRGRLLRTGPRTRGDIEVPLLVACLAELGELDEARWRQAGDFA
jgi:hypothetical protein